MHDHNNIERKQNNVQEAGKSKKRHGEGRENSLRRSVMKRKREIGKGKSVRLKEKPVEIRQIESIENNTQAAGKKINDGEDSKTKCKKKK